MIFLKSNWHGVKVNTDQYRVYVYGFVFLVMISYVIMSNYRFAISIRHNFSSHCIAGIISRLVSQCFVSDNQEDKGFCTQSFMQWGRF